MPTYRVNDDGVTKARDLIDARQYVLESDWSEAQPDPDSGNAQIDRHGWEGFGCWHLAVDPEAPEDTKEHYAFPFGDFRRVHRSALVAAHQRASQHGHDEIARVAHDLREHLDEVSASGVDDD